MARDVARDVTRGVARCVARAVARGVARSVARGAARGVARGVARVAWRVAWAVELHVVESVCVSGAWLPGSVDATPPRELRTLSFVFEVAAPPICATASTRPRPAQILTKL